MSWTFNPPPGWPAQPEGWQPPPGWAPDPSWPPPPPGWQFWVPAPATPAGQPHPPDHPHAPAGQPHPPAEPRPPVPEPAHRPWHRHRWAAGGAALAVLLVGCLGGAAAALVTDPDGLSAAAPEPTTGPTPDPSATTPAPAPSGSGLSVGQERTGEGPAIIELNLPEGELRTITITVTGVDFHQIALVDDAGEVVGPVHTGPGEYTGTLLLGDGFRTTDPPAALDIVEAEGGSWTVQLGDLAAAPIWPDQTSGTGSTVLRVDQNAVPDPVPVTGTHDGESNFIIWAFTEAEFGDALLFNEVGAFSGPAQAEVPAGAYALEVEADGAWTVGPG